MKLGRYRCSAIAYVTAALVILVDQFTKAVAMNWLVRSERIPLVGDLLGLELAFNPGAAFSLGSEFTLLITLVAVLAVVALMVAATRARTGWRSVSIGLILGGAIGNLIDRLFAPPGFGVGHVTDFLAYGTWFIGNLADVALGAGVILLLIQLTRRHTGTLGNDPATTNMKNAAGMTVSES